MTREPEFDDEQRRRLLAMLEYEAGVGECGHHHDWTMDPANSVSLTFEEKRCPLCAAIARRSRFLDERDRKALGQEPDPLKPWPSDGRVMSLRPMTPAEVHAVSAARGQQ